MTVLEKNEVKNEDEKRFGYSRVSRQCSYPEIREKTFENEEDDKQEEVSAAKEEQEAIKNYHFFPNPADEYFMLVTKTPTDVKLTDASGKILFESEETIGEVKIEVKDFPDGIYFLILKQKEANVWLEKVILQRK